jgi:hypothetical protein
MHRKEIEPAEITLLKSTKRMLFMLSRDHSLLKQTHEALIEAKSKDEAINCIK